MKFIIFSFIGLLCTMIAIVLFSFVFPVPKFFNFPHADKIYHFLAYALLTLFLTLTISRYTMFSSRHIFLIGVGTALILGGLIEFAQYLTLKRTPDFFDCVANCSGTLLGYLTYVIFLMQK